ncbi:hypothetical protein KI387_023507, partial [Taxus chinensis]
MDLKVKDMLKLIEEDADSFAKRAEIYFRKRPELVSLVEEFYRAYRALAERYDHITGELHHVQCSMGDAFPSQLRNEMYGISPRASFLNEQSLGHTVKELEEFGAVFEETGPESFDNKETAYNSAFSKEMVNKIVNSKIEPCVEMDKRTESLALQIDSNKITESKREISSLNEEKETLKREHEKRVQEVGVVKKQLLQMQEELHHVQEENRKLIEGSSSYMAQINELQEQVSMLRRQSDRYVEEEKATSHKLQSETQEKKKLIIEIQSLEAKLSKSERQSIQTEATYEFSTPDHGNKGHNFPIPQDELFNLHHENHNLKMQVMTGVQQLQNANDEIQKLHQALLKSQAENDTMFSQYQKSLKLYESAENRAKDLQKRMALAQEENRRTRDEIAGEVLCMKITEESGHGLERETNAFQPNYWNTFQRTDLLQGLREKQDAEQNPGMRILDETARVLNFDTILKSCLQSLSQFQEQQNRLLAELQAGNERLKNADNRIKLLEEEINSLQRENAVLTEKSSSAVMSVKNLEQNVSNLKLEKNNLLNEVSFRVDQRNALQQELYCLKEDRNDLDRKYQAIMKEIVSMGLDEVSIHSFFVSLQDIKQKLRDHKQISEDENVNVPQVLLKMEELLKKTEILEISAISHQLEANKFEFEMQLLQQHVQSLQKENAELMDESKLRNDRTRYLEEKLENVNNLYSQLHRESQQNKDELGYMKHLEEQMCSLQEEKEALKNEIVESTHQMSYSQKQVDLLKGEVKELINKLEEEINKEQMLEFEIKKLQQIICETNNRNQALSDDYERLNENYGAVEDKVKELEETNFKKQTENDMLLHNFSSAIELNRNLELEIENLQKLLGIPYNVEENVGYAGVEGTKLLKSIAGEVKHLQKELSHFQEENEIFLNDALVKATHLKQLQKDMSVLCSEKEVIKEEAALGLETLMSLQKDKSQLQEAIKSVRTQLEVGIERERNLKSEIQILQKSLTSSVSEYLALEGEYQRLLEEHNSTKACLKESESKLLQMDQENQTLLIEVLSQVSLICMLESMIVEKDMDMQLMEEQINNFQEKTVKLEYWLQKCFSKPQMQEAEILQNKELIYGSQKEEQEMAWGTLMMAHGVDKQLYLQIQKEPNQDKGRTESLGEFCQEAAVQHRHRQLDNSFSSVKPECATLEMKKDELQQNVPIMTEDKMKIDDTLHELQGEKQRHDKIVCRANHMEELQAKPKELQEQVGKGSKERQQVQDLVVNDEKLHESPQSSPSQSHIDECENHKAEIWEYQEKIDFIENERGTDAQAEAPKAAEIRESEAMCNDLEAGKKIMGANASSVLKMDRKEENALREEDTNLLSQTEAQSTDIEKHQGHWQKQFQNDVSDLQGRDTRMNHEGETQAQNMQKRQSDVPTICMFTSEIEEVSQPLKEGCQTRIQELCDDGASSENIENNNMQMDSEYKILEFHEERMLKDDVQSQISDADVSNVKIKEVKGLKTQKLETASKEGLLSVPMIVHGLGVKCEEQDLQSQITELQTIIRDLQQDNSELKHQEWKNSAVGSIMGKEYPQVKEKNSKLMLVEGLSENQEEKEVLVDEVGGGTSSEDKVRHDMFHLQQQNQKLWSRCDSATQQIHKLQVTFEELQENLWKTRQDNKEEKADGETGRKNNVIEKRFRELQDELLLWLECNDMLTKEVQYRFAYANRLQAEFSATKGGHSGDKIEEIQFQSTLSQAGKLRKEVLSIREQTSKIADVLRAGSDQARGLEFEVEKILLKLQGETKTSMAERHKKAYIPRVRTSLRVFLFGKEEHRRKQQGVCACMQPVTL